jgi:hypothetical protein
MAGREHELVAVGMLRTPVIVAKSAEGRPGEMHGDVVGRIGKRTAEMAGLRIVTEQGEGHAGHEPHILEALFICRVEQACRRRCRLYAHLENPLSICDGLGEVILPKKSKEWEVESKNDSNFLHFSPISRSC